VNTNESYNGEKYDPYHAILDNGANITIIKDVQLVTNIRRTKHKHDVITMRGVAQYKWEADSIFGTVLYDPTVPYNIISQSNIERLYEHTAIKDHQRITVQHDVTIQSLGVIIHFKLDQKNMFTCNLKCLTKMDMIIPKKPVLKLPTPTLMSEKHIYKPNIKKVRTQEAITHNINEINKTVLAVPSPTNVKKVGVCDHACVDSNITLHNNNDTDHDIVNSSYDCNTSLRTESSDVVEYT